MTAAARQIRSAPVVDAVLGLAQGHARLLEHRERAWASVTFSGTRHFLKLLFVGDTAIGAGEALIAVLPEHEFTIGGQLVADVVVNQVERVAWHENRLTATIELLVLENA